METKYLIIGNSVAGTYCIEGIRQQDKEGRIIVISDEANYSRPLISYYLGKKITKDRLFFRDSAFYKENNVEVILKRVDILDCENKCVLADGERINFEKLLIATGASPIIPNISGLNGCQGVFTFTKLKDAETIIDYIEKNDIKDGLVLGGGLIGLKCTEGLIERGLSVTIIELADRILANTFDNVVSSILENALNKWNCSVFKNETITEIKSKEGRLKSVILKGKEEIKTSLLVVAIGVLPNLELVKETSIKFEKGVLIDEFCQTNIKDIYTTGDLCQGKDSLSFKNSVIAIWPAAAEQGYVAGLNMAGGKKEYSGLFPMNSIELAGIPTISFGITNPQEQGYEVLSKEDGGNYKKIVLKDNKIVGAIFMGRIERCGIYLGLIKDGVDVSSFKESLLLDDFGFLVLPKEYRKHLIEAVEVAM